MNTLKPDNAKEQEVCGAMLRSRRSLLTTGQQPGSQGSCQLPHCSAAQTERSQSAVQATSVKDFGASGNGTSDETAAFQRALDSMHRTGGGTVYAPPGRYLFRDVLNIPEGVTLRGSFSCVPSHTGMRDRGQPKPGDDGTVLLVDGWARQGRWSAVHHPEHQQFPGRPDDLLSRASHRCGANRVSLDDCHAG